MGDAGRHEELWRQLHREVIRELEEEVESLRRREDDICQAAQEREVALLELLEFERTSRAAGGVEACSRDAVDVAAPVATTPAGATAQTRAADLLARLSLTDARIPELQATLRARDEEIALLKNRKALRAVDALVTLKRRLIGPK
jgi:hypothetical protein